MCGAEASSLVVRLLLQSTVNSITYYSNRTVFSQRPGGKKSKIKVLIEPCTCRLEGKILLPPHCPANFQWLWQLLDPSLTQASPHLYLCRHVVFSVSL